MESILLFAQNAASGSAANQKTSSIQMNVVAPVPGHHLRRLLLLPHSSGEQEEKETHRDAQQYQHRR